MKYARHWVMLLLLLAAVGGTATAQQSAAEHFHYITGFRSAQFGMDKDEVYAAIMQDFGVQPDELDEMINLEQGTTVVAVTVPSLSPGPGPASVFYIFGATTGKLMYINVVWATSDVPSAQERNHIAIAGMQLARYFEALHWKPDGSIGGVSLNAGEVLTFAGVDPNDAGVQVIVSGVPMTDADGNEIAVHGPAVLQISYAARFGAPDVVSVEPGAF